MAMPSSPANPANSTLPMRTSWPGSGLSTSSTPNGRSPSPPRAINVLIARGGEGDLPFGVLEVDSPEPGQEVRIGKVELAGFAGLLGIAIERQHADAGLRHALEHQAMLTREMSHRVKNSLASVVGLLRVQSRSAPSEEVRDALKDAASRITTIAQVHDHLWRSTKILSLIHI